MQMKHQIIASYATHSGIVEIVGTKLNGSCVKIMRGTSFGDDFGNSLHSCDISRMFDSYVKL